MPRNRAGPTRTPQNAAHGRMNFCSDQVGCFRHAMRDAENVIAETTATRIAICSDCTHLCKSLRRFDQNGRAVIASSARHAPRSSIRENRIAIGRGKRMPRAYFTTKLRMKIPCAGYKIDGLAKRPSDSGPSCCVIVPRSTIDPS
jgi:hypothetical protein